MIQGVHLTILKGVGIPLPLGREEISALERCEVVVDAKNNSGFSLTFRIDKNSPRYVAALLGSAFANGVVGGLASLAGLGDERVVLMVTIGGQMTVIMDGIVTSVSATPASGGQSASLTFTGMDLTELMRRGNHTGDVFPAMPVAARVLKILANYAVHGVVPMVIPPLILDVPLPTRKHPVQTGNDLEYLRQLAEECGYTFYLTPGPVPFTSTAYWGPQIRWSVPQPALTVDMDPWTNVESLGFTMQKSERKEFFARVQLPFGGRTLDVPIPDISLLQPPLSVIKPKAAEKTPIGDAQKLELTQQLLFGLSQQTKADDCVKGSGALDVLRYGQILRARELVGVRGAGLAYNGLYYVGQVKHSIQPGSYRQNFEIVRDGLVSTVPAVPV